MDFEEYQQLASQTALYEDKVIYPALGLAGETGEVSEKIKKVLRDKGGDFSDETFKDAVKKELGDVLWYVTAISTDLGLNLDDIAQGNIEKLFSRKERGVIQGSGDNR